MKTRRQFVIAGSVGALCPAVSVAATTATEPPRGDRLPHRVGGFPAQAAFERLEGATFGVEGGGGLALEQLHVRASHQSIEQFTLVLKGSAAQPLQDGLYELRHPETGRFALHLAACGQQRGSPLYRADISLLV